MAVSSCILHSLRAMCNEQGEGATHCRAVLLGRRVSRVRARHRALPGAGQVERARALALGGGRWPFAVTVVR
jgi:hypothetical protein